MKKHHNAIKNEQKGRHNDSPFYFYTLLPFGVFGRGPVDPELVLPFGVGLGPDPEDLPLGGLSIGDWSIDCGSGGDVSPRIFKLNFGFLQPALFILSSVILI